MVNMKKVILNQKSYLLYDELVSFKKDFEKVKPKKYEFVLFPAVQYLSLFKDSKYLVGTQNFFSYQTGSFSGEANLESLKDMGITYTLVGYFERRKIMFEPYSIAREKLFKSLNSKCNTILCVGEENRKLRPFSYIKKELNFYLKSIESSNIKYLSICYTPSYALSSADKSVESIAKVVEKIKTYFNKKFGIEIDVYYGGNVEISNAKEIYDICDGIMLGDESVDIKLLKELLKEL